MSFDAAGWRSHFEALNDAVHLNTAGGAPISRDAADAARSYYDQSQATGDQNFGQWLDRVDDARGLIAPRLGCAAEDVAFLAGASVGMNIFAQYLPPGSRVVTLADEFPSVTQPFLARGCDLHVVDLAPHHLLPDSALLEAITPGTAAVAVSHVQFRYGTRVDLAAVSSRCRDVGAELFVDATQSLGAVPIDLSETPVSGLVASAYKWLCSGYGVAVVYVSPDLRGKQAPPVFGWRSAEHPYGLDPLTITPTSSAVQLEMGHPPFAGIFGLAASVALVDRYGGQTALWQRLRELGRNVRTRLAQCGLPDPVAPEGSSGIAVLPTSRGAEIKAAMAEEGLLISASVGFLRLSPHAYATEEEIDRVLERLAAYW